MPNLPKTSPLTSTSDEELDRLADVSDSDILAARVWLPPGMAKDLTEAKEEDDGSL